MLFPTASIQNYFRMSNKLTSGDESPRAGAAAPGAATPLGPPPRVSLPGARIPTSAGPADSSDGNPVSVLAMSWGEREDSSGATTSTLMLQIVGDRQISRDHLFGQQPSAEMAFRSIRDGFDAIIIVVRFTFASIFRQ